MNRKGQGNAMVMIGVGTILTVVILGIVFSFVSERTANAVTTTDDQFTGANSTCIRVAADSRCITSLTSVENGTGAEVVTGNFTTCDISSDTVGLQMTAGASAAWIGETMNATYTDRSCDFITSGTNRTIMNFLPILLAVLILLFIVGFMAVKGRS